MVSEECADGIVVRVPPPDAERMASGIGVDAVAFTSCRIAVLEYLCSERDRLGVSLIGIDHVEVQMNLLGITVGPLWWCVVGSELHSDSPVSLGVEDGMKTVVCEDSSAKHPRPESTLSRKIRSIEHDNLTHDIH
jgi:hypothetical protein